ncbi:hypothetical protein RZS08_09200, partial [Arthrospira platensis SPKY1]|nr:hypothetical protein [Arthrospira platensis SPKY1]
ANGLEPNNREIQQQLVQLMQRRQLDDRLSALEADYQRKLGTNSYGDAVRSLRQMVDIFLEQDMGIPSEAQSSLRALTQLVTQRGETAFADENTWAEAQTHLRALGEVAAQHTLTRRAYQLAETWLKSSRTQALRGIAESTAIIEDKLKGHKAARVLLEQDPSNEDFQKKWGDTKKMVIDSLNEAAAHRIERGQKALAAGEFEKAIQEATRVEEEVYRPVEKEFDGFFRG